MRAAPPRAVTVTDPGPVADDSYLYKATATDAAGNTSVDSNTLSVTIDTLAPAVSDPDLQAGSDTGSSSSDNITKDTSPTFDGTAEAGVGVQLLRGATSVASGTANRLVPGNTSDCDSDPGRHVHVQGPRPHRPGG